MEKMDVVKIEPKAPKKLTIQELVKTDTMVKSAERTLGERGRQFLASVLALANSDSNIASCEPYSTYNACLMAATLDLPVNQNLGFAFVVPYKGKAQFQIGWKGFIQLAQRSGLYKTINVTEVKDGEIVEINRLSGEIEFKWIEDQSERDKAPTVGYVAYFKLLNGFEKSLYMTINEVEKHAKTYSQSYKRGYGVWKDNFEAMARKTVLKLLLNRFAPLSVDMQKAIEEDQKVDGEYADNSAKHSIEVENAEIVLDENNEEIKQNEEEE